MLGVGSERGVALAERVRQAPVPEEDARPLPERQRVGRGGAHRLRPPGRSDRPATAEPRVIATGCAPAAPEQAAPLPLRWLFVLGVVVCLAVIGVGLLAGAGPAPVPEATTVVRVQPGESLWELADRVAPGADAEAVVGRIQELNGLQSSALRPGQPLRVPFSG